MGLSEILWLIVLAAGLLLEGIGLLSGKDKWYTATDLIRRWVPPVLIAAALVWLSVHFNVV
jgi:hypothetical protein